MISRTLASELKTSAQEYPLVAVLGPRQSGKTTLVRHVFADKAYISFENPDQRHYATEDPNGFLKQHAKGAILDEIQRVPQLFSYLQTDVDLNPEKGRFILTGSHQFSLIEQITQSLAGRVAMLKLLPFSLKEMSKSYVESNDVFEIIWKGLYPRIHSENIRPQRYYSDYIETYVQRDVSSLHGIEKLSVFTQFIRACAMRVGQTINYSNMANDLGVNYNTIKSWLSILQGSFIVFLVEPHHANFKKRLIKAPKLYFYDSGLLCNLLRIQNHEELFNHSLKGGIFESFIMAELKKYFVHKGQKAPLYFWRDKQGYEVDCLIDLGRTIVAIEIKAGQTVSGSYFKNLKYWQNLSTQKNKSHVIYAGQEDQNRTQHSVLSWKHMTNLHDIMKQ